MSAKLNIIRFKPDSVLDFEPPAPLKLFLEAFDEQGRTHSLVLEEAAIDHLIDLVQQMLQQLPKRSRSH